MIRPTYLPFDGFFFDPFYDQEDEFCTFFRKMAEIIFPSIILHSLTQAHSKCIEVLSLEYR